LADKNIPVLMKPACCPDLSPRDFWLFPKFKGMMKGNWFGTRHNFQHDMLSASDSKLRHPEIFTTLAGALEQLCECRKGVFEGD
jgi:hypothetical protein